MTSSQAPFATRRVDAIDDEERRVTRLRQIFFGKETAWPGAKALSRVEAPSDGSDCPICLDNAAGTAAAVWKAMPCRHSFHEACLEKWLAKGKEKASCPVCRRPLIPPSELDQQVYHFQLRAIIQRNGKHLLGDSYRERSEQGWTASRLDQKVLGVEQCLRVAIALMEEALPQLAREMRLGEEGARARIELAEAKLRDAEAALAAALGTAYNIATYLTPPVDGAVLRLRPAGESLQAAYDLLWTGHGHFNTATRWLFSGPTPHRCIEAERLAAVGDLEAALQEARAGVEVTSAALADDSLRGLIV